MGCDRVGCLRVDEAWIRPVHNCVGAFGDVSFLVSMQYFECCLSMALPQGSSLMSIQNIVLGIEYDEFSKGNSRVETLKERAEPRKRSSASASLEVRSKRRMTRLSAPGDWKHLEAADIIVNHVTKTVVQHLLTTQYM